MDERLIFYTVVLSLGIFAQWLAWRLRLPSILVLLAFGFTAGQFYDQAGIVEVNTLYAIVSLSVGVILLEGGFSLRISELREAGVTVLRLVTVGSLITWCLTAVAAHFVAAFSWPVAILLGAILVVTGPTVIGPLLRSVKPNRTVNTILKWEGIVIDPVGAVLAVVVFGFFFGHGEGSAGTGFGSATLGILRTLLIGIGLGWPTAIGLAFVLARHVIPDFLQSVFILSAALLLFTVSNLMQHESGLLTVTILGIGLANQNMAKIRHVIEFKENLRTIIISCLFIVLGARIGWKDILSVWKEALAFLAALIIVVRPVSVFVSTFRSKILTWREKLFLSCMAPRGIVAAAVSSIFALELSSTHGPFAAEASRIVPVAYTVIVGTVALYGLFAGPVARMLGLAVRNPQGVLFVGIRRWSIEAARAIKKAGFRVIMIDSNYGATRRARMAGLQALNVNVLSDYVSEELDLTGIGNMLAVTPNDQVNSLACIGLGHSLGDSNVYMFKPMDLNENERKSASSELMGRFIGRKQLNSQKIIELEESGYMVKCTQLNEEFKFDEFQKLYGDECVFLFVIRQSGALEVFTEGTPSPTRGDSIVAMVKQDPESAKVKVATKEPEPPAKLP